MRYFIQVLVALFVLEYRYSLAAELTEESRFLSVIQTTTPNLIADNFTDQYRKIFEDVLTRYNGDPPNVNLVIDDVKQTTGIPFVTIVIRFEGINGSPTEEDILAIFALISPSDASLLIQYSVVLVLERVGDTLIITANSLDNSLWILIPVMAGSLLIAAIIAVICFAIQPNMNDTINKTTGNVFKQQRNPSWVHSGPKVDKLKDGWFAGDSERDVTEAATETIDGSYLQELEDKHDFPHQVFAPAQKSIEPDNEIEKHDTSTVVESLEPDGDQLAENSFQSSDNVEPPKDDKSMSKEGDVPATCDETPHFILSAPSSRNKDDLSLYSLWSYYRAFDGVSSLKPEDSQEHFSLKRPSEFSSTLEYTHPHLLSDPGKAIVEETGKVPPVFVNKAFESDDDEEQDTEPHLDGNTLKSLGASQTLVRGGTMTDAMSPRHRSAVDEIDVAASVRFSQSLSEHTFKQMQAELRRIYSPDEEVEDKSKDKPNGHQKQEDTSFMPSDKVTDLDDSDSFSLDASKS